MKNLTQIVGMLGMLFGMACSGGQSVLQYPPTTDTQKISPEIITESAQLTKTQAKLQEAIEKSSPPPRDVKPLMPAYDPLEDQLISFSMLNENIQVIFYALSQATNMNFILDPQITTQNKQLTLNFDNVSAARVLKEITNTFDLYYEIDENVIRVQPYQERVFKLNFMDTNLKTSFEVGGMCSVPDRRKPSRVLAAVSFFPDRVPKRATVMTWLKIWSIALRAKPAFTP
jgi:type II secretory pathway component GspD/PulD (secretin)